MNLNLKSICTIPRQIQTTIRSKLPTCSPIIKIIDKWSTEQNNTHDSSGRLL